MSRTRLAVRWAVLPALVLGSVFAAQPSGAEAVDGTTVTLHAAICESWSDVPANTDPTTWDDTGHGAELDASADTTLADPSDIPGDCDEAKDWAFNFAATANGAPFRTIPVDGTATVALTGDELAALTDSGLWVRSRPADGYQFAGLRCYDDVAFSDNAELAWAAPESIPANFHCIAFGVETGEQEITFIGAVCEKWSQVPANASAVEWDETGHAADLNTGVDTSLADPSDIPAGCDRVGGWKFSLAGGAGGPVFREVTSNASSHGASIRLRAEELAALSGGGLWVRSEPKNGYAFAGLRCYDDVVFGDNLELVHLPASAVPAAGVYCIGFGVKEKK